MAATMSESRSSVPSEFHSCVRNSLPRSCWKRTSAIYIAVQNVQTGFKPSLIFDFGAVKQNDIEKFVCKLNQFKEDSCQHERNTCSLSVALIEMDFMIWNVDKLTNYLLSLKNRHQKWPVFVDVSSRLETPVVKNDTQSLVVELCDLLLSSSENPAKTITVNLNVTPSINVTSLFGLYLGYPVVYWYEDADASNCLSMTALALNKISRHSTEHDDVVYSFSYPECLAHTLEAVVDEWFQNINDGNHRIGKTVTVHPVVSL